MANRKSLSIFSNSSILLAKISIATLAIAVPLMARQVPPQLQITSPANGTIINPEQTISVTVTSPANVTFRQVAVIGGDPVGLSSTATSVPAQLTLTIPSDISCGELMLTAQGVTTSGQSVESATILVDVERPDLPISLSTPLGGL